MLCVAHRSPADAGECARLAASGAGAFELDCRLSRHGIAVSHHRVVPWTWGRVERDNARLRLSHRAAGDPRFEHAVACIPESSLILLDLKEHDAGRRRELNHRLIAAVADPARFRVSTSRLDDLAQFREAGFATWRTLADPREVAAAGAEERLPDEAVTVRHTLLTPGVVEHLHGRVTRVLAWTVNDIRRAHQLVDMGVEGITTDRLAVIRAVCGQGA